jgi:undecaprenyl pyrophosphate synthase
MDKLAFNATDRPVARHIAIIMDGNGRWACRAPKVTVKVSRV